MRTRILIGLLPALLLLASSPSLAQDPSYVIIVRDVSWIPAFNPLVAWLEADYDFEGDRPWVVEVVYQPNSAAAQGYIQARYAALQSSGGGDLFGMLACDPSQSQHFEQLMIYSPEIAGADLGWGDYVPSWDNYNDFELDGTVETMVWPLPAQNYSDCASYVQKSLNHRFNLSYFQRKSSPDQKRIDLGPPPQLRSSPELDVFWWAWAEAADAWELQQGKSGSDYLTRVTVLCEDFDRDGRSGDLVRQHGLAWREQWSQGLFSPVYQGDDYPYNYFERETVADAKDNQGHQFKITGGTTANKVNMIYFQDQRQSPGWSVMDNLEPNYSFYGHFGLSCALHAIDRADNSDYGRPHAEQVLLATDRGAFVTFGYTRQGYEWVNFWMGEAIFNVLVPRLTSNWTGASAGRAWKDGRNDFLVAHPTQRVEAASFYGMGDPSLYFIQGPGPVVGVEDDTPQLAFSLSAAPNPFNPRTTIKFTLPDKRKVGLAVYDVRGRHVVELLPMQQRAAGHYSVTWDGADQSGRRISSGVYFVRVTTSREAKTAKLLLVK